MVKFNVKNNFMVRIPYCSFEIFFKDLNTINKENIKEQINVINFEENILTSSHSLYKSMNEKKCSDETYESCIKYLIRASTRCTPYGLNAAVIQGEINSKENFTVENSFYKYAKPDMEWLADIIKKIEGIMSIKLNVTLNNSLKYNEVTIEKIWSSYYCNKGNIGGKIVINNTKAIKEIFKMCKNKYLTIEKIIINLLHQYPSLSKEFLLDFIMTLLNKEFIISDLRPCLLISNQLEYLLHRLDEYGFDHPMYKQLININNLFKQYNKEKVSKGINTYIKLIKEMNSLADTSNYIALDMFQNNTIKIQKEKLHNIEEFSNFLVSWGLIDSYEQYVNKFLDKYGNQAVKYIDLIDSESGLGYPTEDKKNQILLYDNFNNELIRQIFDQKANRVIDISDMKNDKYIESQENISFQLAMYPLKFEEENVYLISPLVGVQGLGKIDGRFKYIFKNEDARILDKNIVDVEITFPSCFARHANVQMTTPTTNYVLEFGTKTKNNIFKRIELDNVYVFIDENRKIRFVDSESEKILNFRISNMYNQMYCPQILKTLLDLSSKQSNAIFTIYNQLIHVISHMKGHFPRIQYKNIIILPESWKLDQRFIKNNNIVGFKEFIILFKQFSKENNLPKIISVGPFDQKMLLNITIDEHLKILYGILKKESKTLIFEGIFDSRNLVLKNAESQHYLGEFIFDISNNIKENNLSFSSLDIPLIDYNNLTRNSFIPFEKWISLKLYMRKSMNDIVLRNQVYELNNKLIENDNIDKMFYLRYEDPCQHIRIRIKCKSSYENDVFDEVNKFISELKKSKIITNCIIDTYEQEVARYGGVENIECAEEVFSFDSIVSINILKLKKEKLLSFDLETIYIISSFRLLLDMGMSLSDMVEYLSDYKLNKEGNKQFRKFNNIDFLQKMVDTNMQNLVNNQENINLMVVLEERSSIVKKYWDSINNSNLTKGRKKIIVCSILHMHFNRLIGINRIKENELISILRKLLYIKSNKLKYQKGG